MSITARRFLSTTLLLVLFLSSFATTGFAWGTRTCTIPRGYQASLNVQGPDGNYFYVIVTNAAVNGKWAVHASVQGSGNQDADRLFTDPASQLKGGVKVANGVTLRTGALSKADNRIAADYRSGTCIAYRLDVLYPDYYR